MSSDVIRQFEGVRHVCFSATEDRFLSPPKKVSQTPPP